MSSILPGAPWLNTVHGFIRHFKTRIKVVVHSHNNGDPIYLSDDVVNCGLSKNIKGAGQVNLTLTATRNLLNLLYPNDIINVYFNIGDGQGWVRTFFGFIDRIEESFSVSAEGTPTTHYTLVATDFTKVFDKTEIYFNPHIARRNDFDGTFLGTSNLGGLALMTNGIRAYGSPDEMVTSLIMILLGFGTQFTTPSSYPQPPDIISDARRARAQAALRLIQNSITPEQYAEMRDIIQTEATTGARALLNASSEDILKSLVETYGADTSRAEVNAILALDDTTAQENALSSVIAQARFKQQLGLDTGLGSLYGTFRSIIDHAQMDTRPSFLDYVDLFNFVEREAIDGHIVATSVWQQQGSLLSLITEFSNEIVNEMFFDLRPKSDSEDPTKYINENDDLGENEGSIHYVPALIMREYPFSTIQNLDASQIPISIANISDNNGRTFAQRLQLQSGFAGITSGTTLGAGGFQLRGPLSSLNLSSSSNSTEYIGNVTFGAIFSSSPNEPGRHIVQINNINVSDKATGNGPAAGNKILDVAVISQQEIVETKLGRSDVDHVNLIELWSSNGLLGDDIKFFMQDLIPIVTPVHIMRHGLRRRTLTTRFAAFDIPTGNALSNASVTSQPTTTTVPIAVEPGTDLTDYEEVLSQYGGPVVSQEANATAVANAGSIASTSSQSYASTTSENGGSIGTSATSVTVTVPGVASPIPPGAKVWPVQLPGNSRIIPRGVGRYGYRRFSNDHNKHFDPHTYVEVQSGGVVPSHYYTWHQGLDIQCPEGTPVVAAMDGYVVASAPPGTPGFKNYGGVIVIKHDVEHGPPIYTLYAHLLSRSVSGGGNQNERNFLKSISSEFKANGSARNGTFTPIRVRAGEVIGLSGRTTGWNSETNEPLRGVGPHLHFEVLKRYPSVSRSKAPNLSGDCPEQIRVGFAATQQGTYSLDPEILFSTARTRVSNIITPISEIDVTTTSDSDEAGVDESELATTQPDEAAAAVSEPSNPNVQGDSGVATTEQQTEADNTYNVRAAVDNVSSRKQLARWALLQDHWYQHNLEYLSGTIVMRPAPEIRVGYRLDIYERNMSFYVEGVAHNWSFPNAMQTVLTVTRGQPNNPFPAYIHPRTDGFDPTDDQRRERSRLGKYFIVPDPLAIRRAIVLRDNRPENAYSSANSPDTNVIDTLEVLGATEKFTASETATAPPEDLIQEKLQTALENAQRDLSGIMDSVIDNAPPTGAASVSGIAQTLPNGEN